LRSGIMHRRTWKKSEQKLAEMFGSRRTPLSGINSCHTSSDTLNEKIFIEHKLRKKMPFKQLMEKTERLAEKEGKIPLIVVREKGSPRWMAFMNLKDIPAIAKEMEVGDMKAGRKKYDDEDEYDDDE